MVSSLEVGVVVLAVLFASAMLAMVVGGLLPRHHMSSETRSVMAASIAVVGTMSALVLSLMLSNANNLYSSRNAEVTRLATDFIRLNQTLQRYGPEATAPRDALRRYAEAKLHDASFSVIDPTSRLSDSSAVQALAQEQDMILALQPKDGRQQWLRDQALQLTNDLADQRWLLVQPSASSIPGPLLGGVVLWLAIVFASFGLCAPRNLTTAIVLLLCAFALGAAFKMILDMDNPFAGELRLTGPPIRVMSEPLRRAFEIVSQPQS
jgi:hypothetical protein